MKKNRQLILNDNNLFIEENNVQVYREGRNLYYFEIQVPTFNYFLTCDYLESISAIIRNKHINDFTQIWDIKISNEMRDAVNFGSSLYWLSGGDGAWNKQAMYNLRWDEAVDLFIEQYESILIKINEECETLREVREELNKHLNLLNMYEFGLSKDIIR